MRYFFGGQNTEGIARFFLERKFYRDGEIERVAGCDIEIFHEVVERYLGVVT